MMKLLIVVLLVALIGACEARLPAVGDRVGINTPDRLYQGNITDLNSYFLCLNVSVMDVRIGVDEAGFDKYRRVDLNKSLDVCIGQNAIKSVMWLDQAI